MARNKATRPCQVPLFEASLRAHSVWLARDSPRVNSQRERRCRPQDRRHSYSCIPR